MRVVVNEFMSLDGVVQAPGGAEEDTDGGFAHGGWSVPYFDPEVMGAAIGEGMSTAEALLFGRRTWQGMAAAWPGRAGDPYADQMNAIKKYVASRTLTTGRPDVEQHDVAVARPRGRGHRRAARAGGRRLVMWGSASLVKTLLAEGLVDELNLMIEPILLGGGKRIFPEDGMARPMRARQVRHGGHRRADLHLPARGLSPDAGTPRRGAQLRRSTTKRWSSACPAASWSALRWAARRVR